MWWKRMGKQEKIHFVVYILLILCFAFADMTWVERAIFCFLWHIMEVIDRSFSEK